VWFNIVATDQGSNDEEEMQEQIKGQRKVLNAAMYPFVLIRDETPMPMPVLLSK
jgi:hypothetical protein